MPIDPKNLTAQLAYRGRGNPPTTHVTSAISNCFPGLETDFRNAWKRFLIGVEFHEAENAVVAVEDGSIAQQRGVTTNHVLTSVDGISLVGNAPPSRIAILVDWSSIIAPVLLKAGQRVPCAFRIPGRTTTINVELPVRRVLAEDSLLIEAEAVEAGALTQSLCSPWQADYRECACFYWASSRPDFVNVDAAGQGHNWLHRNRTAATPKTYIQDNDPQAISYEELYRNWEQLLRFEIGGRDE
jgi:hypothetical protein